MTAVIKSSPNTIQLLNVLKYSLIDLAPWLEDKLYHHLKLIPDEDVDEESSPEEEGFFTLTHFKKYGLSLTAYVAESSCSLHIRSFFVRWCCFVMQDTACLSHLRSHRCHHHAACAQPLGAPQHRQLLEEYLACGGLEGTAWCPTTYS